VEDVVGAVVVVLVGEGEYEVFSLVHQSSVLVSHSIVYQVVASKDAVVLQGVGAARAGVLAAEDVEEPEEAQKLSSNPTDILVSSSRKPRRACWSPKTSPLESPFTAKNESLSRVPSQIPRSNTGCGILSVASLLLVFSAVWTTSLLPLERRCCTLALQVAQVLATLLTSSDRCVFRVRFSYLQRIWLILFGFQEGVVYAVEFSLRSGRDLINMAKRRTNVIRESLCFIVPRGGFMISL